MHAATLGNLAKTLVLTTVALRCGFLGAETRTPPAAAEAPIYLLISVAWEGSHLYAHNISAIQKFRRDFPGVALMHFIDPAYFAKRGANAAAVKAKIGAALSPQDDIGLHIHGWKSLVEGAGLVFRNGPTFWGNKLTPSACRLDCGQEVPITIYREDELAKLLRFGKQLLLENGFEQPVGFLAGGWLSNAAVNAAMLGNGIDYDFSSVALANVKQRLQGYPLYGWLEDTWGNVAANNQPRVRRPANTPAVIAGSTAVTSDYLSAKEIVDIFRSLVALHENNPKQALTFHLTFYQETALAELPRIRDTLRAAFTISQEHKISLQPFVLPGESRKIAEQATGFEAIAH